eukprot:gene9093-1188_t
MKFTDDSLYEIILYLDVSEIFSKIQFLSKKLHRIVNSDFFLQNLFLLNFDSKPQKFKPEEIKLHFKEYFKCFKTQNVTTNSMLILAFSQHNNWDKFLRNHMRGLQLDLIKINQVNTLIKVYYPIFSESFHDCVKNNKIDLIPIYLEFLDFQSLKYSKERIINVTDPNGRRAIHIATYYGHISLLKLLIESGVQPSLTELNFGQTCLHIASACGHSDILEFILSNNLINVDVEDADAWTSLHVAVRKNRATCIKILLKYGANMHISTGYLPSPKEFAMTRHSSEISKLFEE